MVFSSIFFLFCFLPVVLALYFALPRLRNAILVAASLVFYAWGEELYVLLMLASIGCNYAMGLLVDRHRGSSRARFALAAAIVANLSLLAWFKYAGFFGAAFFSLIGRGAQTPNIVDGIHLPIGISFFTFQAMSYVIDVYRGVAPVQRYPARLALYISLFPQLIAGPIAWSHVGRSGARCGALAVGSSLEKCSRPPGSGFHQHTLCYIQYFEVRQPTAQLFH